MCGSVLTPKPPPVRPILRRSGGLMNALWPWRWSLSALEHSAFIAAGLLIYVLVTRIGHQRRHPSAAIAWVIGIVAFPYFGIPLFLIFSTRKFVRPSTPDRTEFRRFADGAAAEWAMTLLAGSGIDAAQRNASVTFHFDGDQSYCALLALINGAKHQVEVCTFVLGNDVIGVGIAKALVRAAKRGIRARILMDSIGSLRTPKVLLEQMRRGGVEVRGFMPFLHNPMRGRTNLRNHRKLAVADGRQLWSGGRNLAAEYFIERKGSPAWADLSFTVVGPVAGQAQMRFERDWCVATGKSIGGVAPAMPVALLQWGPIAQWVPSGPDQSDDTIHALLMSGAYHARERILAVTPYFVPDEALIEAWCTACRRGVQFCLVIPARSNHRLADLARERSLRQLANAGAKIWLMPNMVHAKAVVIDSQLALCGSVNLDGRSLFLNYEAMTAFYSAEEIAWLAAWIERQRQYGTAYFPNRPAWWQDIAQGLVRAVGFQL